MCVQENHLVSLLQPQLSHGEQTNLFTKWGSSSEKQIVKEGRGWAFLFLSLRGSLEASHADLRFPEPRVAWPSSFTMWELLPPEPEHLKQPRTYCFSKCSSPNHLWIILILTSLAVHCLRLPTPSAEGTGSIHGQVSRPPHATQCGKKRKRLKN